MRPLEAEEAPEVIRLYSESIMAGELENARLALAPLTRASPCSECVCRVVMFPSETVVNWQAMRPNSSRIYEIEQNDRERAEFCENHSPSGMNGAALAPFTCLHSLVYPLGYE